MILKIVPAGSCRHSSTVTSGQSVGVCSILACLSPSCKTSAGSEIVGINNTLDSARATTSLGLFKMLSSSSDFPVFTKLKAVGL